MYMQYEQVASVRRGGRGVHDNEAMRLAVVRLKAANTPVGAPTLTAELCSRTGIGEAEDCKVAVWNGFTTAHYPLPHEESTTGFVLDSSSYIPSLMACATGD
jgi:hypothetical protein